MFEMVIYFTVIASVCLALIWAEDRITERRGDRRWDHVESALGRGVRITVSAYCSGALPYRCEVAGVVYGFVKWVELDEFIWRIVRGYDTAESACECGAVVLTHPSLGFGGLSR